MVAAMPKTSRPPSSVNSAVNICGLEFANPLGLAAGFDKDCAVAAQAFHLGFGFVEVGTVVPQPQAANRGTTVRRFFAERAIYNRLGFPSKGSGRVAAALKRAKEHRKGVGGVIGGNIACNRDSKDRFKDYRTAARELSAADYLTVNISSPNTEGLRELQKPHSLIKLGELVKSEFAKPIFVKLATDTFIGDKLMTAELAAAVVKSRFDGVILGNTSAKLAKEFIKPAPRDGGISGLPLKPSALRAVGEFAAIIKGEKAIIGCGGIATAADVIDYLKSGAHAVQLYSAMVFGGLFTAAKIVKELEAACPVRNVAEFNPYPLKSVAAKTA